MDIENTLKFAATYLSEYVETFVATLISPTLRFGNQSTDDNIDHQDAKKQGIKLSPSLLVYIMISLLAGILIGSLIPGWPSNNPVASIPLILVLWIGFASFTHVLCNFLRGKGKYIDTLSITLQLIATLFVVENAIALILYCVIQIDYFNLEFLNSLFHASPPHRMWFHERIGMKPIEAIHVSLSALMLGVYMPIVVRKVHRFGWIRAAIVTLPATMTSMLIVFIMIRSIYVGPLVM